MMPFPYKILNTESVSKHDVLSSQNTGTPAQFDIISLQNFGTSTDRDMSQRNFGSHAEKGAILFTN